MNKFLKGFSGFIRNIVRLDKIFWKDMRSYIITLYVIAVFDVGAGFLSRGSQAIIVEKLSLAAS